MLLFPENHLNNSFYNQVEQHITHLLQHDTHHHTVFSGNAAFGDSRVSLLSPERYFKKNLLNQKK